MSEAEEGSAELALETVRRRILLSTVFDRLREEENKREKLDLLFFLFAFASCSLLLLLLSFPLDRVRSRTGFIPFYKCRKRLILLLLLLLLVQSKKDGKQDNDAVDATSLLPFFFLSLTPSSRYLSSPRP